MSKSSRIVVLVVTVVLAIFAFSIIWATRNTEETDILKQARERQNTPLLLVDKPLNTDLASLSQEEKLAEEVRALILSDEEFKNKLANLLDISNDSVEEIANTVSDSVKIDVLSEVNKYAAEYEALIHELTEKHVNAKADQYGDVITSEIERKAAEYEALIYELTEKEPVIQTLIHEVEVADIIDQILEPLTIKVYEQISADTALQESLINETLRRAGSHLEEAEVEAIVLDLYDEYQDDIVTMIVSSVLSQLESNAPIAAPVVEEVVGAEPVVEAEPIVEEVIEAEPVKNEAAEVVEETQIPSEPTPGPDITPEDYQKLREEQRETAIRDILDKIKNNN